MAGILTAVDRGTIARIDRITALASIARIRVGRRWLLPDVLPD
jgi:hypothetical protein